MDTVFFLFELIGVIAFAFSGAMLAIQKEMDILGVCVMGATTAVGGGIMRDVMLGITPPTSLANPLHVFVAIGVSLVAFLPFFQKFLRNKSHKAYDAFMLIADSLGLGIFTVMGVNLALKTVEHPSIFICTFLGVITGVGGGVLRDILSKSKPYIFVKHFYACAAIFGAIICTALHPHVGELPATIIGLSVIFTLRLLAAKYRWKLPKYSLPMIKK